MARSGMAGIIGQLRTYVDEAGTATYADDDLQTRLDRNQTRFWDLPINGTPVYIDGSFQYFDFDLPKRVNQFVELDGGNAEFVVRDGTGGSVSSALYTLNVEARLLTFSADQGGTSYYVSGRFYDVNRTAADVWQEKASAAASSVDAKTDNHDLKLSQEYQHCLTMARHYQSMAGGRVRRSVRSDMNKARQGKARG